MPGKWTTPATAPTFNVSTMLLLTDGTVLAQDSGTTHWWRLSPDSTGHYVTGNWRQAQSAHNAQLYFASAVLKDGTVLVAGGEYNNGQEVDLCAAELYDPLADRWTVLSTPAGWNAIGDAPCCVLPDGKLLLGSIQDKRCALFDPVTRAWTPAGLKQNPSSSEETWTLLPDGSVLTVDCYGTLRASERYANGVWSNGGDTGVNLVELASHEIGPAILLPDGRVFAIGATGTTALYTRNPNPAQPGTWAAGPSFPAKNGRTMAAKDAPACLLPNGHVLCTAGPVDGTANTYDGPTTFFDFDPAANTMSELAVQPANADGPPYEGRMLLLPDGTVLFSNGTTSIQFFEPDGTPDPTWQPHVSDWPTRIVPGTTYPISGVLFNGLSQACSYGDDASMATNYPLVRLKSLGTQTAVVYCRTFNHSSMGVATAAALQSTSFTVPADVPPGTYQLFVVANGIASDGELVTVGDSVIADGSGSNQHNLSFRERELQYELFWRDLNEVHLLIDFVSGRADKSLSDLKDVPVPPDKTYTEMTPQLVVRDVCMIRFPPVGTATSTAQQAAFLLTVKDNLNRLADPARGLTVAYTAMFSGVAPLGHARDGAAPARHWQLHKFSFLFFRVPWPVAPPPLPPAGNNDIGDHRHLFAFATEAYPNLLHHARKFKTLFEYLPMFAIIAALMTAYTYWDVATGNGILQRISALDAALASMVQPDKAAIPTRSACSAPDVAMNAAATNTPAANPPTAVPATPIPPTPIPVVGTAGSNPSSANPPPAAPDAAKAAAMAIACRTFEETQFKAAAAREDLEAFVNGSPKGHPVGWVMKWLDQPCTTPASCGSAKSTGKAREELATVVVGVFTNYVVPMMFGLLGTLAGLVRTISAKVRESVLSPRDRSVSVASLPLGLVAGLAVGLLFSPSNSPAQGISSPAGAVTLSAAALAFLAGYGADSFFTMVDALLKRVFAIESGSSGK